MNEFKSEVEDVREEEELVCDLEISAIIVSLVDKVQTLSESILGNDIARARLECMMDLHDLA